MPVLRAIGLMSGTSLDGIDAALIETDGEALVRSGPTAYHAYTEAERALLRQALAEAVPLRDRAARPGILVQAEELLTRLHGEAVEALLRDNGIAPAAIDVIGFHGQTVLHRPELRLTVQIGDGAALAARLDIPVVFDLRQADVAAGGQGAPLVPAFHRALVVTLDRPQPVAVLNVGGVANVTWCDGERDPVACDTGPGNALIDDFMQVRTGRAFDRNGGEAARGTVDEAFVAGVLDQPFFDAAPPKSLDRNDFALVSARLSDFSTADGAATLTALTAAAVARVVPHLPTAPRAWIVGGGGARNAALMRMLAQALAPATVETADQVGWSADALEAQAFAYLAVRSLHGRPITFPATTGVPRPMTGGVLAHAPGRAHGDRVRAASTG